MGHWYAKDGKPLYTVPMANGKGERDTTLRDARKLNLVPSVTTILGIVDKPALTRWKLEQLFEAITSYLPSRTMSLEQMAEYKKTVFSMSEKKGKDAAELGSKIHDALEKYYLGEKFPTNLQQFTIPVVELLLSTFGNVSWVPEAFFAYKDGYGGKCDLHLLPCDEYPNGVILDFKTKSAEDFSKVKAYDEQCMQLVAYREGFNLPKAECYNLFISTKEPGKLLLHKWEEKECQKACKMFSYLLNYWQESNNFKG